MLYFHTDTGIIEPWLHTAHQHLLILSTQALWDQTLDALIYEPGHKQAERWLYNQLLEPHRFIQEVFFMKLKQIEDEVLQLSEDERAELAQKLLLSLDEPSESEIAEDWLLEAQRRARELDEGIVQPVPADEVRRKAQALLR